MKKTQKGVLCSCQPRSGLPSLPVWASYPRDQDPEGPQRGMNNPRRERQIKQSNEYACVCDWMEIDKYIDA